MNAADQKPNSEAPSVGGVKVRPLVPIVLYLLLVVSAGVGLWAQRNPAQIPHGIAVASPWIFLAFAVGFAAYRLALVIAHRYSFFKALFQIFSAAIFFLLLLFPGSWLPKQPLNAVVVELAPLRANPDPQVRALAAELGGHRGEPQGLLSLGDDQDPSVRQSAHAALVRLNKGVDLGPLEDPAARAAWGARFP